MAGPRNHLSTARRLCNENTRLRPYHVAAQHTFFLSSFQRVTAHSRHYAQPFTYAKCLTRGWRCPSCPLFSFSEACAKKGHVKRWKEICVPKEQGWNKKQRDIIHLRTIWRKLSRLSFRVTQGTWTCQIHPGKEAHSIQYQGLDCEKKCMSPMTLHRLISSLIS